MEILLNSLRRSCRGWKLDYVQKQLPGEISQNSQENTRARVSFLIKKETLAQVFSCEFCEISKNTFSHTTPPVAASVCS